MSVKIMGAVWDTDLPAIEKFVLLAFADHADHSGENARPGIALIAKKCNLSERQTQVYVAKLKEAGYLIPQKDEAGGRGRSTSYRISFPKGEAFNTLYPQERVKGTAPFRQERVLNPAPFAEAKGRSVAQERVQSTVEKGEVYGKPLYIDARAEPSRTIIEPAAATHADAREAEPAQAAAAASTSGSDSTDQSGPPQPNIPPHGRSIPRGINPALESPTDAVPLALDRFEAMPWAMGYAAYCDQFPGDAVSFREEIIAKAGTAKPIRTPERYFRQRMLETLRGDRVPAQHSAKAPSIPSATHNPPVNPALARFVADRMAEEAVSVSYVRNTP